MASIVRSSLEELWHHVEEVRCEVDNLSQHPIAREHNHERNTRKFWNERERLFLDLGSRLHHADRQANEQLHDQDWPRQFRGQPDGLNCDFSNGTVVHGYLS